MKERHLGGGLRRDCFDLPDGTSTYARDGSYAFVGAARTLVTIMTRVCDTALHPLPRLALEVRLQLQRRRRSDVVAESPTRLQPALKVLGRDSRDLLPVGGLLARDADVIQL